MAAVFVLWRLSVCSVGRADQARDPSRPVPLAEATAAGRALGLTRSRAVTNRDPRRGPAALRGVASLGRGLLRGAQRAASRGRARSLHADSALQRKPGAVRGRR